MCEVTKRVLKLVTTEFSNDPRLKSSFQTGVRECQNGTIGWVNLYPEEDCVEDMFRDVSNAIEKKMKEYFDDKGEVQVFSGGSGENIDIGVKQALIKNGKFFEIYCFNCYSLTFIRIWLEEGLIKTTRGKKWISIDVDEILDSPWFKE